MKNRYSIFSLIKNALSYHENWQRAWKDPAPKKEYDAVIIGGGCLLYTSPSPRDKRQSRMPSSA